MIFDSLNSRLRHIFLFPNGTNVSERNSSLSVDEMLHPENIMILLTVIISIFILVTVLGNTLVIVAFIEDKRLRNQSNFFLLNLAICDFFIGAFCVPMYVPYLITGKWMLGSIFCKLWLVVDNLMCTASALSVVLISYDRFLAVTMAVTYHSQQKKHSQTVLKMIAVWVLSCLVYSPAILLWDYFDEEKSVHDNVCIPGYFYSWYFLLGASTFDFILPLTSISFFNLSIYLNIKIRSKNKRQVIISSISTEESEIPGSSGDKKIAKSLSLLVCVFCICWAPYSLLMVTRAACHDYCIDSYWYEITFWLLWINSSINPLLYPLCHKSFKRAFIKVIYKWLCIKKKE
uniref:G-protein coupled receptors family 1 profile domain-containing protein n=1 Tax=Leptobrachium leishanense TaxID=445787 RepID=A0A8C5MPC4_9ANUR